MYFKIAVFLFLSFLIAPSGAAHADETEHGHKTPHGGIMREAEGMHVEFLVDKNGEPKVYLYDKSMKPLDRTDLGMKLTVRAHNGDQHERGLMASKNPKEGVVFKGEPIKGSGDWDTAVVSLKVKNQWHHIRFSHH